MPVMKRLGIFMLAAVGAISAANAEGYKPEMYDKLPEKARIFIGEYFGGRDVEAVKKSRYPIEYGVVFADGTKAEFDADGEWMEVDCRKESVPTVIVPSQIRDYVRSKYPGQDIVGVSRDRRGYDVELSNGYELGFDRKFRLVEFDD